MCMCMCKQAEANKQVPQHVTTLLSHLTSRPGVQSTLILSRRDGSVIQSTGILAESLAGRGVQTGQGQAQPEQGTEGTEQVEQEQGQTEQSAGEGTEAEAESSASTPTGEEQPQAQIQGQPRGRYQPSHAETLAARIFSFVSSASDLSMSLSHPEGSQGSAVLNTSPSTATATATTNGTPTTTEEEEQNYDDDEVKLLRLRTRKHEIVVVPDRKYLLCVVQDAVVRR